MLELAPWENLLRSYQQPQTILAHARDPYLIDNKARNKAICHSYYGRDKIIHIFWNSERAMFARDAEFKLGIKRRLENSLARRTIKQTVKLK